MDELLNAQEISNSGNVMGHIGSFLTILLALGVVILIAYFSIRLMGGARNLKKSGNIKIIEAIGVGYQSNLQLVKVGKKHLLIGVSRAGIKYLTEIEEADINTEEKTTQVPFERHLAKFFKKGQDTNDKQT